MVEHSKLFRLIAVLGVVFITIYFAIFFWIGGFFGLLLPCYIINGIIGINIHKRELMVKHSKLFRFITVLGAVFVTIFSTILYLSYTTDLGGMVSSLSLGPYLSLLYTALMFFLLIGGTVFLTVGILGFGRKYFKNHRSLFTVLTFVLVPLFIFILIFLMIWFAPLTVNF
jgi:hypothetical protein